MHGVKWEHCGGCEVTSIWMQKKEAGQIDLIETNKPVISGSAPGRDHSNNWRWVGHLGAAKWFAGNSGKMHWLNKKVRQLTA